MMQVPVKPLRAALKAIKDVVEAKATIPILSNVLVKSTPGQMFLTATDLDIMVEKTVDLSDAGANRAMQFCVDAGTLASIAAKLPADGVAAVEADGNVGVTIKCGRARFKLPTLPTDDFPLIAHRDWDAEWEQDATALIAMMESVRFAIANDETRYYLNGIFVHVPDGSTCQFAAATNGNMLARYHLDVADGAATNGNMLARYHLDVADGAAAMPAIILPRKAVKVLGSLLDEEGGVVGVSVSTTKFRFAIGQTVLTGKLIDGTFPDYTRVIPPANPHAAWFEPKPLIEAVERVLTISSDKTKLVALSFADDVLTLDVASPENGTASEELPINYDGPALKIGFNGGYLLDVLRHLVGTGEEGAQARVKLADPAAPSLWQQSDDGARLYVLMPMRV